MGVPLKKINEILSTTNYDREEELEKQLAALLQRKSQLEDLIANVKKTICSLKGEGCMSDIEKFEGFKKKMIADNEIVYGKELRERYGDEIINASNAKVMGMSNEQWQKKSSK